jgi:hypothetical protein
MDRPSCAKGDIFYERPSPLCRPRDVMPCRPPSPPVVPDQATGGAKPNWMAIKGGFHIHRNASENREPSSDGRGVKHVALKSLESFGASSDLEFLYHRSAGSCSPQRSRPAVGHCLPSGKEQQAGARVRRSPWGEETPAKGCLPEGSPLQRPRACQTPQQPPPWAGHSVQELRAQPASPALAPVAPPAEHLSLSLALSHAPKTLSRSPSPSRLQAPAAPRSCWSQNAQSVNTASRPGDAKSSPLGVVGTSSRQGSVRAPRLKWGAHRERARSASVSLGEASRHCWRQNGSPVGAPASPDAVTVRARDTRTPTPAPQAVRRSASRPCSQARSASVQVVCRSSGTISNCKQQRAQPQHPPAIMAADRDTPRRNSPQRRCHQICSQQPEEKASSMMPQDVAAVATAADPVASPQQQEPEPENDNGGDLAERTEEIVRISPGLQELARALVEEAQRAREAGDHTRELRVLQGLARLALEGSWTTSPPVYGVHGAIQAGHVATVAPAAPRSAPLPPSLQKVDIHGFPSWGESRDGARVDLLEVPTGSTTSQDSDVPLDEYPSSPSSVSTACSNASPSSNLDPDLLDAGDVQPRMRTPGHGLWAAVALGCNTDDSAVSSTETLAPKWYEEVPGGPNMVLVKERNEEASSFYCSETSRSGSGSAVSAASSSSTQRRRPRPRVVAPSPAAAPQAPGTCRLPARDAPSQFRF